MASATGWISPMAAGASAQRVSTIGKAPALRSTSIKSAAELSATTTMGPNSAMTTSRCAGWTRYLRRGLLTARYDQHCRRRTQETHAPCHSVTYAYFPVNCHRTRGHEEAHFGFPWASQNLRSPMRESYRKYIEVAPGRFVDFAKLHKSPEDMVGAVELLRGQLREVLGGLAPVLGPDVLLKVCREVIDEDRPRP